MILVVSCYLFHVVFCIISKFGAIIVGVIIGEFCSGVYDVIQGIIMAWAGCEKNSNM